jgi:hydrogenase-4 transcriptional activator
VAPSALYDQAVAALERGHGADAATLFIRAMRQPGLSRDEQVQIRCGLAEAWLLEDDVRQASDALGAPPEGRERLDPARLSDLWRMHGRLAVARGEPTRGIALLTRALRQADRAHDARCIGLARYELGLCYRRVGEAAIVREHLAQAASALHAAGDRRSLAMVHSLSGILFAQEGRLDEAMSALRQGERLAVAAGADDVVATICGNQANVALMQHRHEQALTLAERSVALQEAAGTPHGLGVALASLGQICVRVGNLARAEETLNRALDVRSPLQFMRETTGAVFDTLAQIHLIRGEHDEASYSLQRAREAYGEALASRWYQWSIRTLEARLALRRRQPEEALDVATQVARSEGAPAGYLLQAELIAVEALLALDRIDEARVRLEVVAAQVRPDGLSGTWGEFLRVRGRLQAASGRTTEAYHDLGQSVSVFELLGERYQAGLSHLELGRLAGSAGALSKATRYLTEASAIFEALGAAPDLADARAVLDATTPQAATGGFVGVQMEGDAAIVQRLVDASVTPLLLAREGATALLEAADAEAAVLFVQASGGQIHVLAASGCDQASAAALAQAVAIDGRAPGLVISEAIGRAPDGQRTAALCSPRPLAVPARERVRTLCAVLRQGFELCAARERPVEAAPGGLERHLEELLPGFLCAGPVMQRIAEQIQRMQGNDLTVLVTGESGTGKDLVARAIHAGSPRSSSMFLPYNCTSATRELADSQLFGHRRGSFTGALADSPGVLRTAVGGTLFLDEVGDLPLDVQPKLLRFLEQGEVLPVGETRPQKVDVRVVAATNADLEGRVSEGRFREDLFYRLSVIRIHVPPLRERREEIPHLSTYFLREAIERLGRPHVRLSPETLDLFDTFPWPGNVRQLRNEIQRAVAMVAPEGIVTPELLSPAFGTSQGGGAPEIRARLRHTTLATAVEKLEREMVQGALQRAGGNISETARGLGLTRRGLYLKMDRLGIQAKAPMP